MASKCTKKNDTAKNETAKSEIVKSGCAKLQSVNQRCTKKVRLSITKICALLDTDSNISLLSKAKYDESDLPSLNENSIVFHGVGAKDNKTSGFVDTTLEIDYAYIVRVHVIPDNLALHDFLLGNDFIDRVELNIKGGNVHISVQ